MNEMSLENVHTHPFYAMGSHMTAWLQLDDPEWAGRALQQVEAFFFATEQWMTRFDQNSELSRLNARPEQWLPVSAGLWQVIGRALDMAWETGGLFDPTLLSALEAAGYSRSFEQLPSAGGPVENEEQARPGRYQEIKRDATRHAIWLPDGVYLDLGGIGKGYTAQQAISLLNQWGPCLIDAGGDLCAGDGPIIGGNGAAAWPGWPVSIVAPWSDGDEGEDLLGLWLSNATLATSGVDYRHWTQNGRPVHHIINPSTGLPAETDALTVSVLSSNAVQAEAWATAALVAGTAVGYERLCQREMAAALATANGELLLTPAMQPLVQPKPAVAEI